MKSIKENQQILASVPLTGRVPFLLEHQSALIAFTQGKVIPAERKGFTMNNVILQLCCASTQSIRTNQNVLWAVHMAGGWIAVFWNNLMTIKLILARVPKDFRMLSANQIQFSNLSSHPHQVSFQHSLSTPSLNVYQYLLLAHSCVQGFFKKNVVGAGEMTESLQCLLCKHKVLSSDPWHLPKNLGIVAHTYNLSIGKAETRELPGLTAWPV